MSQRDKKELPRKQINIQRKTIDDIVRASQITVPSSVTFAADFINRIQQPIYTPGITAVLEMQKQMYDANKGLMSIVDMASGIQNNFSSIFENIQKSASFVQNNKAIRMFENMQSLAKTVQNNTEGNVLRRLAVFPNIPKNFISKKYWDNFEFDNTLDEVANILEDVKSKGFPDNSKLDRLIEIATESLIEQKETNKNLSESQRSDIARTRRERFGLLIMIITLIIVFHTAFGTDEIDNEQTTAIKLNSQKIQEMSLVLGKLLENSKEATANLRLRKSPNTRNNSNIIFIIPSESTVSVSYSVSGWSYIIYIEDETGKTYYGWVSKRYLK